MLALTGMSGTALNRLDFMDRIHKTTEMPYGYLLVPSGRASALLLAPSVSPRDFP